MDGLDSVYPKSQPRSLRGAASYKQTVAAPPAAEVQAGLEFAPGARVFDLVTGQEGVVVCRIKNPQSHSSCRVTNAGCLSREAGGWAYGGAYADELQPLPSSLQSHFSLGDSIRQLPKHWRES